MPFKAIIYTKILGCRFFALILIVDRKVNIDLLGQLKFQINENNPPATYQAFYILHIIIITNDQAFKLDNTS